MPTLDQILAEVEPIFRDGAFVMPSFQEVLTARQFAEEINSGKLSVSDACEYFWSYEEDAELWELPKDRKWRAFLPADRVIISMVMPLLEERYARQTAANGIESFLNFVNTCWVSPPGTNRVPYIKFNPFLDDLNLICASVGKSQLSEELRNELACMVNIILSNVAKVKLPQIFSHLYLALGELASRESVNSLLNIAVSPPYNLHSGEDRITITPAMIAIPILFRIGFPKVETIPIDDYSRYMLFEETKNRLKNMISQSRYPPIPFYGFPDQDVGHISDSEAYQQIEKLRKTVNTNTYFKIRALHKKLQPQGYNPPVKRLAD